MKKPQLTFLPERVPTNLGFFYLRDLSINWYTGNLPISAVVTPSTIHISPPENKYFQISGDIRLTRPLINNVACPSSHMYLHLYSPGKRMHRKAYDPALQAACSTASISTLSSESLTERGLNHGVNLGSEKANHP
jgi:hypothetical protein